MKKISTCLLGILILASCSQIDSDENFINDGVTKNEVNNQKASLKERCNIHIEDIEMYEKLMNGKDSTKVISEIQSITCDEDTVLYIVDYKNDKGWTIYSSDKRAPVIVASSEKGNYNANTNAQRNYWLGYTTESIYKIKNSNLTDTLSAEFNMWNRVQNPVKKLAQTKAFPILIGHWELVSMEKRLKEVQSLGRLTKTRWHQTSPWNSCVPNLYNDTSTKCVAGCVPIAGAQCIYAIHEKLGIPKFFYSSGDCYGWSAGSNHNYTFSFGDPSESCWAEMAVNNFGDTNGKKLSALLIGYVGNEVHVEWNKESSGAETEDLVGVLRDLGISSIHSGYDTQKIRTTLERGLPVIIRGKSGKKTHHIIGIPAWTEYTGGHAWLIDGYEKEVFEYVYAYVWLQDGHIDPDSDEAAALDPEDLIVPTETTKTEIGGSSIGEFIKMNWGGKNYDYGRYVFNTNDKINFNGYQYRLQIISDFKSLN